MLRKWSVSISLPLPLIALLIQIRGLANVQLRQGSILALEEELDGSFDLIVVADTIYYLPPPIRDSLLKEPSVPDFQASSTGRPSAACESLFSISERGDEANAPHSPRLRMVWHDLRSCPSTSELSFSPPCFNPVLSLKLPDADSLRYVCVGTPQRARTLLRSRTAGKTSLFQSAPCAS